MVQNVSNVAKNSAPVSPAEDSRVREQAQARAEARAEEQKAREEQQARAEAEQEDRLDNVKSVQKVDWTA